MSTALIVAIVFAVWIVACVFIVGLCKAAAMGDEISEAAHNASPEEDAT